MQPGSQNPLCEIPFIRPQGMPENAYDVHDWIYARFCQRGPRRFLFSIERDLGPIVLVRSRHFPADYLNMSEAVEVPEVGERRAFRLIASPTVTKNGKKIRLPPGDRRARIEWLAKRAPGLGFELIGSPAVTWRTAVFQRKRETVTRESAVYHGALRVTDAALIEATLEYGVGRSHAMGFGLLRLFREN